MSHNVRRRDILKGIGAAGTIGVAGCIGSENGGGGGGGGGDGPDVLNVIGYPESGIQLFRDYYSETDGSHDIIVPDGLRDGAMPGQVGNDMDNVIGTAPAAGGPNQDAFNDLYQDAYGESPGVFTSQSYDSVALLILANVAAGENSGRAIKEQMRRVANPEGEEYGPGEFVEAVEAVANGEDVNYQGASSATNFNDAGDPASAAYSIWEFEGSDSEEVNTLDTQTFEGDDPSGSGPSAADSPGGLGREVVVGILLPETGDLASVGGPMINAAELPVQQVNEADIDLEVNARFEDTQTSPDQGVSGAESLVSAGVPAVCGTASSGVNVPVSQEVFIPNEVVGCSPSSTALSVTNLDDNDYIFRTAPSDLLQGAVMAQVSADRLDGSTAATLYVNNDYGQQLSERFSEVFEDEHGGEVLNQVSFNIGESSYSNVIEQALSE